MIIDTHGHISAPPELYAYKSMLLASRGYHGKGDPNISDERMHAAVQRHVQMMKEVGTDIQFISARPFQMMHSEKPERIVHWWAEAINNLVYRQCQAYPDLFMGIACLPQCAGVSPKNCLEELERCVKELGFIGCLLNPDPGEGDQQTPPLADEYWYPLYEKLVELDVPALIHTAGCKNPRWSYSLNFIIEESVGILSLLSPESRVFEDFPTLKLIFPHGGGSIPYQMGRWRAHSYIYKEPEPFEEKIRKLWFDTCLYTKESIELLIRTVGSDRVLFGTEKPGSGSAIDPNTGKWMDDLKPVIESIEWLTEEDKKKIFEDNARALYKIPERKPAAAA